MAWAFNPFTGKLDQAGTSGGNPFDQNLNTTDCPTFIGVQVHDNDSNPDEYVQIGPSGIYHTSGSDSSWYINPNGVGFQNANTSTAFTAGQIAYTPSGGTQKTYTLPPDSGTLATTESIPVTSVNGNTGDVVLNTAEFIPNAWVNIVASWYADNYPAIQQGRYYLASGTYGTTSAVYRNASIYADSIYYSSTDSVWHIVTDGETASPYEYTTTNSSGFPASFSFSALNADSNPITQSVTLTHGTTEATPSALNATANAGTLHYAARLDHQHPFPTPSQIGAASTDASSLTTGILNVARLPSITLSLLAQSSATTGQVPAWSGTAWVATTPVAATTNASSLTTGTLADARLSSNVVTLTGTQTLTNKTLTTPNVGNGTTNAILTSFTNNVASVSNSTTACGFSVFNTRTDSSNYESGIFDFTTNANALTIGTAKLGTGTARRVRLDSAENIDFYVNAGTRVFQCASNGLTAFSTFGWQMNTSASDPTTSSTPFSNGTNYVAVYKNTTTGVVSLWVRDGSTMKKAVLA